MTDELSWTPITPDDPAPVRDFDCGVSAAAQEVADFITGATGELQELLSDPTAEAEVRLYWLEGELVGFAAFGKSLWGFPKPNRARIAVNELFWFGVRRHFQGKPEGDRERHFSWRILEASSMAMQTVQLELPDEVLQRLKGMATQTQQPLENVIAQSIRGNLPPILDDLPPEQRNLVVDLQALSDEKLWTIARESLPSRRWRRHQRLLQRAETGALANAARAELTELREATDRFVTRRSYALALLKWRGYAVPNTP